MPILVKNYNFLASSLKFKIEILLAIYVYFKPVEIIFYVSSDNKPTTIEKSENTKYFPRWQHLLNIDFTALTSVNKIKYQQRVSKR